MRSAAVRIASKRGDVCGETELQEWPCISTRRRRSQIFARISSCFSVAPPFVNLKTGCANFEFGSAAINFSKSAHSIILPSCSSTCLATMMGISTGSAAGLFSGRLVSDALAVSLTFDSKPSVPVADTSSFESARLADSIVNSDSNTVDIIADIAVARRHPCEQLRSTVKCSFNSSAIRWRSCEGPSHRPIAADRCIAGCAGTWRAQATSCSA